MQFRAGLGLVGSQFGQFRSFIAVLRQQLATVLRHLVTLRCLAALALLHPSAFSTPPSPSQRRFAPVLGGPALELHPLNSSTPAVAWAIARH